MPHYKVYVIGHIWWPNGLCSSEYEFSAKNDEDAEYRIDAVAGDFSVVTDFALFRGGSCPTCGGRVWECIREFSEEGALTFEDCMA